MKEAFLRAEGQKLNLERHSYMVGAMFVMTNVAPAPQERR